MIFLLACSDVTRQIVKSDFANEILTNRSLSYEVESLERELIELDPSNDDEVEHKNATLCRLEALKNYDNDKKDLKDRFSERTKYLTQDAKDILLKELDIYFKDQV